MSNPTCGKCGKSITFPYIHDCESGNVWCVHMIILNGEWVLEYPHGSYRHVGGIAKFCEICGKPRPEEPKSLWQEIARVYHFDDEVYAKLISNTAFKWFQQNFPRLFDARFDKYEKTVDEWIDKEIERCQ